MDNPHRPYCDEELAYTDYFGYLLADQSGERLGDIYKCKNEECDAYEEHFYTLDSQPDDVKEGYPC